MISETLFFSSNPITALFMIQVILANQFSSDWTIFKGSNFNTAFLPNKLKAKLSKILIYNI